MALHDRILLATDLSARSDRAMDRALMLARREGAELVVLHVLEPMSGSRKYPPTESLAVLARAQVLHDLGDTAARTEIRIEEGDPAEVIVRVAREQKSTLIVVGVARSERLGRFVLGATVERLVRGIEMPLLIVTDRPRGPYQRVCVAVDFSSVSRETLELTTSLFPNQPITAFHAFKPAVSYGGSDLAQHRAQFRAIAENDLEAWLASANLTPESRALVKRRLELGDPARWLREAAAIGDFDLVVLGTRGRGRLFEFFIGSVAKQILAELPCDSLFVRESKQT